MNNIAKPSTLPVKSDYHLFRYGIKPEWEDPQNRGGGKSVDTQTHSCANAFITPLRALRLRQLSAIQRAADASTTDILLGGGNECALACPR